MVRKLLFSLTIALLFTVICQAQQPIAIKKPGAINMRGAYLLTRQMVNSGSGDSTINIQQQKIYTDKYMMYAHQRAEDSLAVYGVGTYKIENGKVIENIFYTNDGPQASSYELAINNTGDGYTQTTNFPADNQGTTFILTEDYKKAGKRMESSLDGAWKQTKVETIMADGRNYMNANPIQYKVYESGNYIWANSWKDSASGKLLSAYGYGTFQMKGPDKVTESTTSSTYASTLVGQPIMLQLKFMGKDKYEQTIKYPDGMKMIETYERMK
jgi:hypothetical protein